MKQKELKDLNLLDRFLFAEAVEDPETLQDMLEIILGRDVLLKHLPQTEKEERNFAWSRQIRLDVWAMDEDSVIYDTEVQQKNTYNIPKRLRLYHSLIDSKLMAPGDIDYNKLNDVYIIMIMPFDLFGKGRYQYTFRNGCDEFPGLKLEDGATTILLNTHGTDPTGVSEELIALLHYFEDTSEEVAEDSGSRRIIKIQEKIAKIRASDEIGVRYMNEYEERMLERQEGFAEGEQLGLAKGEKLGIVKGRSDSMKKIVFNMKENGFTEEQILCATGLSTKELEALEGENK